MSKTRPVLGLPSAPKARGEVAEARFVAKALSLGFTVLRPFGDSNPYDFVVGYGKKLSRVQVKSAWWSSPTGRYHLTLAMGRTTKSGIRPYRKRDIDYVAAYIAPEDKWYLLPIEEIGARTQVTLHIKWKSFLTRFEERWDLLC